MARNIISRLSRGGSARKSRRHSRRRSARLSSAKTARRSDTWLVLSGALAAALAPISGPFVSPEAFCSRQAAAVRPCGSAAELIGRRVKLLELGRIGITRWPRESRLRGRPRRGRFRHAPGGRHSRDGEGRLARLARRDGRSYQSSGRRGRSLKANLCVREPWYPSLSAPSMSSKVTEEQVVTEPL